MPAPPRSTRSKPHRHRTRTPRETLHGLSTTTLIRHCATLPALDLPAPRPGSKTRAQAATHLAEQFLDSHTTIQVTLNELARTLTHYDTRIAELAATLDALVHRIAPRTIALHGLGPDPTGQLLITAGNNPERLHSEAAFACLTGTAPQDSSSGKNQHHRLSRAGDRAANPCSTASPSPASPATTPPATT